MRQQCAMDKVLIRIMAIQGTGKYGGTSEKLNSRITGYINNDWTKDWT